MRRTACGTSHVRQDPASFPDFRRGNHCRCLTACAKQRQPHLERNKEPYGRSFRTVTEKCSTSAQCQVALEMQGSQTPLYVSMSCSHNLHWAEVLMKPYSFDRRPRPVREQELCRSRARNRTFRHGARNALDGVQYRRRGRRSRFQGPRTNRTWYLEERKASSCCPWARITECRRVHGRLVARPDLSEVVGPRLPLRHWHSNSGQHGLLHR